MLYVRQLFSSLAIRLHIQDFCMKSSKVKLIFGAACSTVKCHQTEHLLLPTHVAVQLITIFCLNLLLN